MCRITSSSCSLVVSSAIQETREVVDDGVSCVIDAVGTAPGFSAQDASEELPTEQQCALSDVQEEHFAGSNRSGVEGGSLALDGECFPSFAELISDCQQYAKLSGCRFHISAFDGIDIDPASSIPVVSEARAEDAAPLLSAKLRAASSVRSFTQRLKMGDPELLHDLAQASELVAKESARNAMIAFCKAVDCFPPSPAPAGVKEEDCLWDAVESAPAEVIAQKLYNDEVHRILDDVRNTASVQAKTASFVLEFAEGLGIPTPQMSKERMERLSQFQNDLEAFASRSPPQEEPSASKKLPEPAALALALGAGALGLGIALSAVAGRQRR